MKELSPGEIWRMHLSACVTCSLENERGLDKSARMGLPKSLGHIIPIVERHRLCKDGQELMLKISVHVEDFVKQVN